MALRPEQIAYVRGSAIGWYCSSRRQVEGVPLPHLSVTLWERYECNEFVEYAVQMARDVDSTDLDYKMTFRAFLLSREASR